MKYEVVSNNIAELLGAEEEPAIQRITLYIPDKDNNGKKIKKLKFWIKEARRILTMIGRGSTALPPSDGTWMPSYEYYEDAIVWEKTIIIYTMIEPELFEKNIHLLRNYLHSFGKETNQGEVVFEYDGELFKISKYDK